MVEELPPRCGVSLMTTLSEKGQSWTASFRGRCRIPRYYIGKYHGGLVARAACQRAACCECMKKCESGLSAKLACLLSEEAFTGSYSVTGS